MINRKDFVKTCVATVCATGFCGHANATETNAAGPPHACDPRELAYVQERADAARLRFSKLIEIIAERQPEHERRQTLRALGVRCAETYKASLIDRYKGNLKGFLEEGRRLWMEQADYDEAKGTIRIVDRSSKCSCPLVKEGVTPPSFCDCTLGWQVEAYSTILGRPVTAELEQSILRGGKKCIYRITIV